MLKKQMAEGIPDQNKCKQRLDSYEAHEEGTSKDSAAPLFADYIEEQGNLRFMNKN
jgi:hypothetical protein